MTTRKQDASTIVGEELAEELEAKSQLVGKADVESPAIVIKAAKKPPVEEEAAKEGEEEQEEREEKPTKKPKGGSYLTDKAYTWQAAKTLPEAKSFSRVELMGLVRRNLTEVPEGERLVMLEALLDDINTELTEIKTAVEDLYFTQPAVDEPLIEPSREEEPMTYLDEFTQEVTEALESNEPTAKKAEVIQKSLANVALRLRAELEAPANGGDMVAILRAANAPLVDAIAQLTARMGVQQPIILPTQKGVTAPVVNPLAQSATQLPVSPVTGQPSSLTEMVRRSVGL